jgi:signal peptidase I
MIPKRDEVDYIKRAIGLPGDVVDIKDGSIYVNGNKLNEPYTVGDTNPFPEISYPVTVPQNKIFAVGDHRNMSRDSRQIGFIDMKKIKGKAVFRLYPIKNIGRVK